MQVHFGVDLLDAEWDSAVACIGTFDGVHLGHQQVIATAVRHAEAHERPSVLVTFDRHPAHILAPERCPKAIASLHSNIEAFQALGVAVTLVLPFDYELSETAAEDFFDQILIDRIRAASIVVGHDFAFGHGRKGTPDWLRSRIETLVVPPFEIDGHRVSSSEIRKAIEAGNIGQANRLLGRSFEITGVVVSGEKLGRKLGYPTINVARSFDQILPPFGVYAGAARCSQGRFAAAINIGTRPTVGGAKQTIEAYLLDYPGEPLYGQSVSLEIHDRIRDEAKFDSIEELTRQIAKDVEFVRASR